MVLITILNKFLGILAITSSDHTPCVSVHKKIQYSTVGLEKIPAKTHQHKHYKINITCQLINQSQDQYTRVLSIYKQIYKHIQTNQNNNIAKPVAFPKLYVKRSW